MFENRKEAGKMLAEKLLAYRETESVILAVPRGGIPIGYELAKQLSLPLDIILAKKIGHPQNPEFAIGAVSGDNLIVDHYLDITEAYIAKETKKIRAELKEKEKSYNKVRPSGGFAGKTVIVTDDGIATGNTLMVITALLKKSGASRVVVAVPVMPLDKVEIIAAQVDELVYVMAPKFFPGVGAFYQMFNQVDDEEAKKLLEEINQTNEINNHKK